MEDEKFCFKAGGRFFEISDGNKMVVSIVLQHVKMLKNEKPKGGWDFFQIVESHIMSHLVL